MRWSRRLAPVNDAAQSFETVLPADLKAARADKVLASIFQERSRARVQKTLDAGFITRDGIPVRRRDTLHPGDTLQIRWLPENDLIARPVSIPLDILYEDASLVVVNKPPGLVTHPGHGTREPTLVDALLYHTGGTLSSEGGRERPGIVHRLDRETSGAIVVAKTDAVHRELARQFKSRETVKEYLAWVDGVPGTESGTIEQPIGRHPVHRTRMQVTASGRPSRTDWSLEKAQDTAGVALLRCRIHTGRTHQIRVHLNWLGYPILGDGTYGYKSRQRSWEPIPRVMLHARYLQITHPESGDRLALEAPVPSDFLELEERLGVR